MTTPPLLGPRHATTEVQRRDRTGGSRDPGSSTVEDGVAADRCNTGSARQDNVHDTTPTEMNLSLHGCSLTGPNGIHALIRSASICCGGRSLRLRRYRTISATESVRWRRHVDSYQAHFSDPRAGRAGEHADEALARLRHGTQLPSAARCSHPCRGAPLQLISPSVQTVESSNRWASSSHARRLERLSARG